jgi:hypothetical protein
MLSSTHSSAASALPFPTSASNSPTATAPSGDEPHSFSDFLHEQGGDTPVVMKPAAPTPGAVIPPAFSAITTVKSDAKAETTPTTTAAAWSPASLFDFSAASPTPTTPPGTPTPTSLFTPHTPLTSDPTIAANKAAATGAPIEMPTLHTSAIPVTPTAHAATTLGAKLSSPAPGAKPTNAPAVNKSEATPATSASPALPATTPTSSPDLATMMVQAILQATQLHAAVATPPAPPRASATTASATPAKSTTPGSLSFSAVGTSGAPTFPAASTVPAPAPAASATPSVAGLPVSTSSAMLALASAAVATSSTGAPRATTGGGREIPSATALSNVTTGLAKEKKSASDSTEGIFLQATTASPTHATSTGGTPDPTFSSTSNLLNPQPVTTTFASAKTTLPSAVTAAAGPVGTAHVDKKAPMTNAAETPEMLTTPTAAPTPRQPAEVNILLGSNHDFTEALKQVMHIAQLSDTAGSRTPTRIAIELQTPPGAVVNVYVSKQDDQYRAQLSTNDPVALSWVQDKITTLRQENDPGVNVKWLPAQIEGNSLSATTPSSDGSNLNWNRDGQQQPGYQQPDERSQSQRRDPSAAYEDPAESDAELFATSFATVGGAT